MEDEKLVIYFKSIGNAPVLKNDKVALKKSNSISTLYK